MALSSSLLLISFFLVIPLAITVHKVIYSGWVPPSDYGSGEMFNAIADRYDFINRVMSLGMDTRWRERMVQTVHASLNDDILSTGSPRILDVSTGTADVALLLAKEIPRAAILGIDPSDKMLEFGREKVHKQELDAQIVLEQHDARDLRRLEEKSFDAATMAFGIRNVPEKDQALCEIHRLLKDASRFCILEFAEPDESAGILGAIARVFIRHVVPFLGGILSGQSKEYMHLQNSIKDFPSPAEFVDFIKGVKCPTGSYQVDELIQMNGDSVQLYVCTVVRNQPDAPLMEENKQEVTVNDKQTEPDIDEEQVVDTVDVEEQPAAEETIEEVATDDATAEQVSGQHEGVDQERITEEPEATAR